HPPSPHRLRGGTGRLRLSACAPGEPAAAPAVARKPAQHAPHPNGGWEMPAKSQAQQKAAGAALSAKRGDTKKSDLKGASKSMVDSMSEKELERMASTKRKGKPEHASKSH